MKYFFHYLLCAVSMYGLCCSDLTRSAVTNPSDNGLSADDRSALQNTSRFHEVHSTSDLPATIIALCAGDNSKMADPGQKWNATDVIIDPSLPGKRLIWAAVGDEYYVVHFERGGIAHTFHILIAKLTNSGTQPKVVWRAMGGPFKDYAALVDALRTGKLDDRFD